jgi:carbon storage regulator
MLVLTRRLDESIEIGDSITIKVLSLDGDKVKLGINAPRDITILRSELTQALIDQIQVDSYPHPQEQPENPA